MMSFEGIYLAMFTKNTSKINFMLKNKLCVKLYV